MGSRGSWFGAAAMMAALSTAACGPARSAEPAVDRDVTLAPAGGAGAPTLALSLSGDFTVTRSTKGADFDLHYVGPDGGDEALAHAVIYVGHHPTSFHGKPDAQNVASAKVTVRGEKVDVYSFDTKPGVAHKEAVLRSVLAGSDGLVVHLAAGGTSREALDRLWTHLLTIRAK
jgi:hypothetical protein